MAKLSKKNKRKKAKNKGRRSPYAPARSVAAAPKAIAVAALSLETTAEAPAELEVLAAPEPLAAAPATELPGSLLESISSDEGVTLYDFFGGVQLPGEAPSPLPPASPARVFGGS